MWRSDAGHTITIKYIEAQGLGGHTRGSNTNDCFCIFKAGKNSKQTTIVKNSGGGGSWPTDVIVLRNLSPADCAQGIEVFVFDKDRKSSDDLIGKGTLRVTDASEAAAQCKCGLTPKGRMTMLVSKGTAEPKGPGASRGGSRAGSRPGSRAASRPGSAAFTARPASKLRHTIKSLPELGAAARPVTRGELRVIEEQAIFKTRPLTAELGKKPMAFTKPVRYNVGVPVVDEERVPVMGKKVKPSTEKRVVKVKKQVPVVKKKWVEEEYVEIEETTEYRDVLVWKEVLDKQPVVVKKPVTKTQLKEVEYTEYEEVYDEVEVDVDCEDVVEEEVGHRIDKTLTQQDVEVIEHEKWEWQPVQVLDTHGRPVVERREIVNRGLDEDHEYGRTIDFHKHTNKRRADHLDPDAKLSDLVSEFALKTKPAPASPEKLAGFD